MHITSLVLDFEVPIWIISLFCQKFFDIAHTLMAILNLNLKAHVFRLLLQVHR